jgi:hypothetical protein
VTTFSNGQPFLLPSARKVSNAMTSEDNTVSSEHTVLLMQMGQVEKLFLNPEMNDLICQTFVNNISP